MIVNEEFDTVVVGGGQAGISLSYYLKQHEVPHVVLERERAFSSWHNRWDGFYANTPNWMNTLPIIDADKYPGDNPKGFATREELVAYFEDCLNAVDPLIRINTEVGKINQLDNDDWEIHTNECIYHTKNVAICIGAMSVPKIPQFASNIATVIPQIHSSQYKNPEQITTKSVLLVGSGSSGVQICNLLCQSGKFEQIHIAQSKVLVLPSNIFGIQVHRFLHFLGLFDIRNDSLLGKLMYSNLETKGDPIMRPAPIDLAKEYGVRVYGKLLSIDRSLLHFSDGQTLEADDLTIIWCTGFRGDYSFIKVNKSDEVFDSSNYPIHKRGVIGTALGLYFVGLRYQYTVASHDIYGVGADAEYIATHICNRMS